MVVVRADHLKYRYPHTDTLALDDVTCEIEAGEFIGVVGANGAGKSSFAQALLGLVPRLYRGAYAGCVEVCGMNVRETPIEALCQHVGLVFQNPFNQLTGATETVYEELAFGLENYGIPIEDMHRRIAEVMDMLGIGELKDRSCYTLSGGQQQRVAIAGVMVMNPCVLVLDEPTSQLDVEGTREVFRAIEELKHNNTTIIMVEHKVEKLAEYSDRVMAFAHGKLVAFDTPDAVFARSDLREWGIEAPARFCAVQKGFEVMDALGELGIQREMHQETHQETNQDQINPSIRDDVVSIDHVSFSYNERIQALKDVSLQFRAGTYAIIGENGSGKTTLAKLMKGLIQPSAGKVSLYGRDIAERSVAELAPKIGLVFQNPDDQMFETSVIREVMFGCLQIGMSEREAQAAAQKALEELGIFELAETHPYDVSLSARKMVALASVLAMDPCVIILDEPTIGQDMRGKARLVRVIGALERKGKVIIAVLHDMDFVREAFDHVVVMNKGRVAFEGSVADGVIGL